MKKILYLILVLFMAGVIIIFFSINSQKNGENNNENISKPSVRQRTEYTKTLHDPEQEIEENKTISTPEDFNSCKETVEFYNCLLDEDKGEDETQQTIKSPEKLTSRLDNISSFKNELTEKEKRELEKDSQSAEQQTIEKISYNLQDSYINRYPKFIYEADAANCEKDFCKKIITETKKQLVERLNVRNLITNSSVCSKIPEQEVQQYCESLF